MQVICQECGWTQEEEKAGRYYCVQCGKYTEFFSLSEVSENE
jgi:predicted nucleic-acid-binding Zn-ribbon protein